MAERDIKTKLDIERKVEKYRNENIFAKKGQVVFVGSSLMEMFPIEEFVKESGSSRIVYNRGIGGYTTMDLLQTMDVCIYDLKPYRIFINIGTNDLSDADIEISQLIKRYEQILILLKDHLPQTEVYMMAYYPVNYEAATEEMRPCVEIRNNKKIEKANEEVKKLAAKYGEKYIDVNHSLKDAKGSLKQEYTIEGIHINEEGYRAIFEEVMSYVDEPLWEV